MGLGAMDLSFWKGKKVFLTGHTGFKGSWLSWVLTSLGAKVTGYSLKPPTEPNLFSLLALKDRMDSRIGDIRDFENLKKIFDWAKPEMVFHLAAQPLVREGYSNPLYTYETNVLGTANILECLRLGSHTRSALIVTTDKVYQNNEWPWGYRENDRLGGFDPYSNSKSCAELVTESYRNSFLRERDTALSTARAGNVLGGGDFAKDRIIPDCVRSAMKKEPISVRNPFSIRPYQHVLEPIFAYMDLSEKQYRDKKYQGNYNIGPEDRDCVSTGDLAELFCKTWGQGASWKTEPNESPHEAQFLKLDCSKIKAVLGWRPRWTIKDAVEKTCQWTKSWISGEELSKVMEGQIKSFLASP